MTALDITTIALTLGGVFFYFAGTVGLFRLPDFYSRLHALTKADNLGLGLIVFGLLLQTHNVFTILQLLLIWVLVMAASAAGCHLVARHIMRCERNIDFHVAGENHEP